MPANNEAASSPSPTDAKPNDSSMSNTSESSSSLKSADRRSSSGGGSEATITKETVSSSEDQTETRAAAEVKENESSSPVGGKIRQSSSDNRIGNDGSQQSANGESRAEQEAVGSQAQQKPNFEQESRGGGSSAFSSSVSLRSGARPLVYMYSPPKRSGQLDGAATKSNKTVSVSGKSPGRRARQAQVAPQASKAGQQQKKQKAVATHQQRPLSQQRKLKQTEDQRSSAHGEDAAANREKKTRAQSARFSSRNKSGRSRGSSSSSSSSTRKSGRRSKNRSHSRSGRTRRSAERSNREQTVEGREAKAYAHQLKQARAELLTARSRALKTLTVKHRRESRGLPQCLRYPKLLTADTYSASYIYSDTRIIDANLKKDRGDRYQPVFRGTSGALVDPWDDLALAKPARRVKRNNHHHPRPSQSRQSRGHRGASSPLGDRREASASSRGRQQQREAAASRQGDREYTRQNGKKPTEYSREPVFFNQLPEIRSRIKASRSARASRRRDVDYASAADECRRCLDSRQDSRRQKSAADGRQSRRSMAMSCSAYLSATPGSRAAVHDCIRRDDDRQAAGRPASDADEHENQSDNEAAQDNKSDRSSVSSARSSNTGRSSPSSSNQSDRRIENESD